MNYKEYQELNLQQSLSCQFETQGILFQLMARFLAEESFSPQVEAMIPSKIMDSINYIQLNMSEKLSVKMLALRVNMHVDYFSRLFLQTMGVRPMAYILDKRIERAQYLMITRDMTLEEIATQTGFENVPYFSKVFKSFTNFIVSGFSS